MFYCKKITQIRKAKGSHIFVEPSLIVLVSFWHAKRHLIEGYGIVVQVRNVFSTYSSK